MDAAMPSHAPMRIIKNICVYCGSGLGANGKYAQTANILGKAMAGRGIGLVYGGASIGIMGEIARAVRNNGGHVTGVIPRFLTRHEVVYDEAQEMIFTETMQERKHIMAERADAFVALPGGIGTLEELVEMMTLAQLDRHAKPIVMASIDNFWDPLIALFSHMRAEKFIRPEIPLTYKIAHEAEDIVPLILAGD
jgi:uncharacterized protein (TIGR00730 family)